MLQTMLAILSSASKAQLQTPASAACLNWCTSCLWSSDYLLRHLAVSWMPVLMQGTVTAAEETSVPKLVQVGSADLSHDFCQGMLPHCRSGCPGGAAHAFLTLLCERHMAMLMKTCAPNMAQKQT